MTITVLTDAAEIAPYREQFCLLSNEAAAANVFYESWMLEPALRCLKGGAGGAVSIVLVKSSAGELLGVFPIQEAKGYRRVPISYYSTWKHLHCFLGMPLIRKGAEQVCLDEFIQWSSAQPLGRMLVLFDQVPDETDLYRHILEYARRTRLSIDVLQRFERPFFFPASAKTADHFGALSSKHRKDLKGKRGGLEKLGAVEFSMLSDKDKVQDWTERFLCLEADGWKGRNGTAMLQHHHEAEFFRSIVAEGYLRGKLQFLALLLNGEPIAMRCAFRGGSGIFSFKIAFDEAYKRFSPGLLLEVENMRQTLQDRTIEWVDSCAAPGSALFERLWTDQRGIVSVALSHPPLFSRWFVKGIRTAAECYASVKRLHHCWTRQ